MRRVQSWDFGIPTHLVHKYFAIGLSIATAAYQYIISPEIQAHIATYSALCVMFDDEVMQMFPQRFYANAPQLHLSLDRLAEILRSLWRYFPPFSADAIVISTMDFVNAELLLKNTSNMSLVPGPSAYIKYTCEQKMASTRPTPLSFFHPVFSVTIWRISIQAFP